MEKYEKLSLNYAIPTLTGSYQKKYNHVFYIFYDSWAAARQNQQNDMYAQRKLRSA